MAEPPVELIISAVSSTVSGRLYGERLPGTLRPVQKTVAPASPSARAMPRPAPRVAPATTATRPASDFLPANGRVRDTPASADCLGRAAIAIPPEADDSRINRCVPTGVRYARKGPKICRSLSPRTFTFFPASDVKPHSDRRLEF